MAQKANDMFERLSRELHLPQEEVQASCRRGDAEGLLQHVEEDKAEEVKAILRDPARAKALLESPQAQELMKLLQNNPYDA